jgi:hypothetical protein
MKHDAKVSDNLSQKPITQDSDSRSRFPQVITLDSVRWLNYFSVNRLSRDRTRQAGSFAPKNPIAGRRGAFSLTPWLQSGTTSLDHDRPTSLITC